MWRKEEVVRKWQPIRIHKPVKHWHCVTPPNPHVGLHKVPFRVQTHWTDIKYMMYKLLLWWSCFCLLIQHARLAEKLRGPTSTNSAEHTTKITLHRPGESGLLVCDMLGGEFCLSAEKGSPTCHKLCHMAAVWLDTWLGGGISCVSCVSAK